VDSYDRLRNYLQRRFNSVADAEEVLQVFVLKAL
jgi:RNA polymerase sigma-70 factor (ECF subfamily)